MSFLDACSFTFDGQNSDSYNLAICWIDDKADVSINGLKRNIENSNVNYVRLKTNNYGVDFENNIEFSFCIIKKDESCFSRQESIAINNWLTKSITPKILCFNDDSIPSIHYYAVCTSIEDIVFQDHVAKQIKFETNSPFGFMNIEERRFIVDDEDIFTIDNLADTIDKIYYPRILISTNSSEDIIIENMNDQKSVALNLSGINADASGLKNILIDNAAMRIMNVNEEMKIIPCNLLGWDLEYESYVSSTETYMDKIYWFRLIEGINKIKVTGNCDITFIFEFPRKVGCL